MPVVDRIRSALLWILDTAHLLLKSSPVRAIGYGAAVVIWLVTNAFGVLPDLTWDQAVVAATSAIAILVTIVESIRSVVTSPTTVERLRLQARVDGRPDGFT